ncbi:MAG: TrkA family potassium uptake protein [Thermoflexales bacterium]|nr:TrkA family potassium uptake protein [Thermoflexales bacterium]MCS7325551.1 TrkA family potassium uptake protein [Thermoflexales bacterium]MDW8053773.1 TrkA family potassium uptake protein [Anaerolineae bacterium]MDW8293620.1 TrkA family potassium uptake protein [Anaerolineae bacterium]
MPNSRPQEYAVIGLGRFGSSLARTLMSRGASVLGIDRSAEIVQQMADELTQAVVLDATDENALRDIGITDFHTVIVAIGSNFEANLMTTVALRELGVPNVICKALTTRQRDILLKVGATRVILPEHEAGQRLALELLNPGMLGQLELGPGYAVMEMCTPPSMVGEPLGKSELRKRGINVLAIRRADRVIVTPAPDTVLKPDDVLVVLGSAQEIERCARSD